MESSLKKKQELRHKRKLRVRRTLRGSPEKPRLCVIKTNKHIEVQLIDDVHRVTLASISTRHKEMREKHGKKNKDTARVLGEHIAELAKKKQIVSAVFDRGCFKYHGILASLAEAAREKGLKI